MAQTPQFVTPQIPASTDVTTLRLAVADALGKLTTQLNQNAATPSPVDGAGQRVTNVATPTSLNDAVNKRYLDKRLDELPFFPPRSGSPRAVSTFSLDRQGYAVVTFDSLPINNQEQVSWAVFAVDETDAAWYGSSASGPGASGTNVTFTQVGSSRYDATVVKAGDYIVWNDSANYEINRVKAVVSTTSLTLVSGLTTGTRSAYFGSILTTHSNKNFYRLNVHSYVTDLNGTPAQKHEFIAANKCVVAAASPYKGYTISLNLNHSADTQPAPGLRTMNGAEYILGAGTATLSVGQTSDLRIPVASWESIRNVYAWVQNSPAGTASNGTSVQLTVLYIDPTLSTVGFIGTASITAGSFLSWTTRPDGLNMPPQSTWPPSILPVVTNALATTGTLTAAGTNGAKNVVFQPDGFIDFIVTQVGATTAGGRLGVTAQT